VTIIAPDGLVVGESDFDRTQMENHAHRPEVNQARNIGHGTAIRFSDTVGYDMLYVAVNSWVKMKSAIFFAPSLQQVEQTIYDLTPDQRRPDRHLRRFFWPSGSNHHPAFARSDRGRGQLAKVPTPDTRLER
jgi:hypothetical protein